jgi:hypothetical protein
LSTSPRLAAAIVAATVGIVFVPAAPAIANPHPNGPSHSAPGVNDTPRGRNFLHDIGDFFDNIFRDKSKDRCLFGCAK